MIFILNRRSGSAAAEEKLTREISAALGSNAPEAHFWWASSGEELAQMAQRAVEDSDPTVVAGGGDGTINAVANAVAGSSKRMGVLPLGTLNHFAKDLGIPLDVRLATETLVNGRETCVDVGEVNGRVFLNNSSLGLYPRLVRHREQQRVRLGRGKWPAFAWALLSALQVCPSLRLNLRANGRETVVRTPFLFIGNNAYSMDLLKVGSRERLDGGALGVYYARAAGRWGLIALALRSLVGRVEQATNFEAFLTGELHVGTRRPSINVSTDGEVTPLEAPLTYRIRPQALRVIVPQSKTTG